MNPGILDLGYAPPQMPRPLLGQPQPVPTPYGPARDPYWNNVSILLRMDGRHGSRVFTDSSNTPTSVAVLGDSQLTAERSRFDGGTSGVFDGSGDFLGLGTGNAGLAFGSSDFTIEAWVFRRNTNTAAVFVGQANLSTVAGSSCIFYLSASGTSDVYAGSTSYPVTSPNPAVNVWAHVAFVRAGTNLYTFLNGAIVGSRADLGTATMNTGATTHRATIGALNTGGSAFNGFMSNVRITRGVARYTAAFPAPTAPFPIGYQ